MSTHPGVFFGDGVEGAAAVVLRLREGVLGGLRFQNIRNFNQSKPCLLFNWRLSEKNY
jgi:hypothetical protein